MQKNNIYYSLHHIIRIMFEIIIMYGNFVKINNSLEPNKPVLKGKFPEIYNRSELLLGSLE